MESRVKPEDVAFRQKWMERITNSAETFPAEVFRLMEWVIIIAAVLVADERLNSSWLQWLAAFLSLMMVARVNWFLSDVLKHPEEMQPDGSLVVKFKLWTALISLPVAGFAYYLAFGVSALFAESDLVERTPTAQATVAPQAAAVQPSAKAPPQAAAPQATAPETVAKAPTQSTASAKQP